MPCTEISSPLPVFCLEHFKRWTVVDPDSVVVQSEYQSCLYKTVGTIL